MATTPDSTTPIVPMAMPVPRFWSAVIDVTAVNATVNIINRFSGHDFASISPESWARNFDRGTSWDGNDLQVNHFGHPVHGSAYFNAARANGYGFWGAAPFALGGSLMWEFLGETHRPSSNDILSTTLGGIILGEAVQQLTVRLVDNQARGLSRVMRESAVALLNPGLGLHRLSRGDAFRRGAAAPAARTRVRLRTEMGVRQVTATSSHEDLQANQPVISLRWQAGDPYEAARQGAFETFELRGELSAYGTSAVSGLEVQAPLVARAWGRDAHRSVAGVGTRYLFLSRPGLQRSEAEFLLALAHRASIGAWTADGRLSAGALPLAAISSSSLRPGPSRRSYDYAVGGDLRLSLAVAHARRPVARVTYEVTRLWVLDGAATAHSVESLGGEIRIPLFGGLAMGTAAHLLWQRATYADGGAADGRASDVGLFLAFGE